MNQLQRLAIKIIEKSHTEIVATFGFKGESYQIHEPLDLKKTRLLFEEYSKLKEAHDAIIESLK